MVAAIAPAADPASAHAVKRNEEHGSNAGSRPKHGHAVWLVEEEDVGRAAQEVTAAHGSGRPIERSPLPC